MFIIDTRTGALVEWLAIKGAVTEMFGVATLPGVLAPKADGPATPHLGSRETIEQK